jgi:ferric-dicitrate binding protein FerR (iron transport regulator)
MENITPYYLELALRALEGSLQGKEKIQFEDWLKESDHKAAFGELERLYAMGEGLPSHAGMDMDSAWKKVEARTIRKPVVRPLMAQNWFRYAAALVLLIGGIWLWFGRQEEFKVVQSGASKRMILLEDGSRVTLNKGSELRFKTFSGKLREVKLKGDAFFEVAKNPDKPFIITAYRSSTEVLGTSFQISSDSLSGDDLSVVTGKVSFQSLQKPDQKGLFVAGQSGKIGVDGKLFRGAFNDSNFRSWQTGRLDFENARLETVASDLERHFGVQIYISEPGLKSCRFTGHFQNAGLFEIQQTLQLSLNLMVERKGKQFIWKGRSCP